MKNRRGSHLSRPCNRHGPWRGLGHDQNLRQSSAQAEHRQRSQHDPRGGLAVRCVGCHELDAMRNSSWSTGRAEHVPAGSRCTQSTDATGSDRPGIRSLRASPSSSHLYSQTGMRPVGSVR